MIHRRDGKNGAYDKRKSVIENLGRSRHVTYLEDSEPDTGDEKVDPVFGEAHAELNGAPCNHKECKPVAHTHTSEDEVARQLANSAKSGHLLPGEHWEG